MAKKVKITKGGQTVYPATVMDAVVHPDLRVDSSKLIGEVNVSKIYPTGGIDGTNKYTLETAIAKIPSSLRNVGLKCSFLDDGGKLQTWEYLGGAWAAGSFSQVGVAKFSELGYGLSGDAYVEKEMSVFVSGDNAYNKNGNIDPALGGTFTCYRVDAEESVLLKGWYENAIESIPYIITKQSSSNDASRILAETLAAGNRNYEKTVEIPEGYGFLWVGNPKGSNIRPVGKCLGEQDKAIYPYYKYIKFSGRGINGDDGEENSSTAYSRYTIDLSEPRKRNAAVIVFPTRNHSSAYRLGWAFYDSENTYISGGYSTHYGTVNWMLEEIPDNAQKFSATLGNQNELLGVYFIDSNLYSLIKDNKIKLGDIENGLDLIKSYLPITYDTITNDEIEYRDGYYNASAELVPRSDNVWKGFKLDISGFDGGTLSIKGCCPSTAAAKNGFVLKDGTVQTFGTETEVMIPNNVQYVFASFQLNLEAQNGYSAELISATATMSEVASKEYVQEELKKMANVENGNNLRGKSWQVLGDSISTVGAYAGIGKHYYNIIAEKYGMDFTDENVNANAGRSIAYNKNEGVIGSFVEHISELTGAKDITTILGGTNDYIFNTPLGEFGKDVNGNAEIPEIPTECTDFYSALVYIYNFILTNFPTTKLFHILPPHRGNSVSPCENSLGFTMEDYWNAIIEVAEYFSVGIIPLGKECSMNPRIESQRLIYFKSETNAGESTHPNESGQKKMADFIGANMNAKV